VRLPIPPPGLSGIKDYIINSEHSRNGEPKAGEGRAAPDLFAEVRGTVEGHRDGHGFVYRDDGQGSIYLPPAEMRAVLHGDTVVVRVVRQDRKGRPEGRVVDIVERRKAPVIGRLLQEGGTWIVAPEDRRYGQDVLIPRNATGTATAGQVVCVELTEPPTLHAQPVGRVVEVLGEIDDPGLEIEIAVRKYGVPHVFSEATVQQAQALPPRLRAVDRRQRVDLTDVALVTIDGEDARDFDDAVYAEPLEPGAGADSAAQWRLIVAIADVSHYVKPGEPLDTDAYERATSVYFPRRVIPMLPERLSNGLCSLNPDEDRLAMVCDMVVDAQGEVQAYQFYPAVMRSHARLTYTEVAAILANTRGSEAQRRGDLVARLLDLHEVYRALLRQRARRGAVDFETTETQIVCDDSGRIEKIVPRTRTEAHRLIEEAMLAANVCAAHFIEHGGHAALFRVHEGPTPEKRTALQNYLRALGIGLSVGEEPSPGELQAIAQATRERPDAAQIHQMLLRSMQQALYTPFNSGHFGLAYGAYTHFTSPIRRYPDLLVHRVIKALLSGRRYRFMPAQVSTPRTGRARPAAPAPGAAKARVTDKELQPWEAAGAHTSACERRADEASRDVEAWLKCRFMRDRLGEEFGGTVTAAVGFGVFVTLDELHVEGLVHITELGGEYFRFDEVRQELRGERSGMRYGVGTRVRVQVSRVDLDARRIDFRLVREGAGERLLARGRAAATDGPVPPTQALAQTQAADRAVKAAAKRARATASRKSVAQAADAAAPRKAASRARKTTPRKRSGR
jgi:ribonuclease R